MKAETIERISLVLAWAVIGIMALILLSAPIASFINQLSELGGP
jgi:hypothetical protein